MKDNLQKTNLYLKTRRKIILLILLNVKRQLQIKNRKMKKEMSQQKHLKRKIITNRNLVLEEVSKLQIIL